MALRVRILAIEKEYRKSQIARLLAQLPNHSVSEVMSHLNKLPWALPELPTNWKPEEFIKTLQKLDCKLEVLGSSEPGPKKKALHQSPPITAHTSASGPENLMSQAKVSESSSLMVNLVSEAPNSSVTEKPESLTFKQNIKPETPVESPSDPNEKMLAPSEALNKHQLEEIQKEKQFQGPKSRLSNEDYGENPSVVNPKKPTVSLLQIVMIVAALLVLGFILARLEGGRGEAKVKEKQTVSQSKTRSNSQVSRGAGRQELLKVQADKLNDHPSSTSEPGDTKNYAPNETTIESKKAKAEGESNNESSTEGENIQHSALTEALSKDLPEQLTKVLSKLGRLKGEPEIKPDYTKIRIAIAEQAPKSVHNRGYFIYRAAEKIYAQKALKAEIESGRGDLYDMDVPARVNPVTRQEFDAYFDMR